MTILGFEYLDRPKWGKKTKTLWPWELIFFGLWELIFFGVWVFEHLDRPWEKKQKTIPETKK